jgi:putative hydrolase of the HAD superfamily
MAGSVEVVAWDFDGVLNRNIVDGRFVWADDFEQDIGKSRLEFEEFIFSRNLDAILTGREDLRDRIADWASSVGYPGGADALLAYWFEKDARPDPFILRLMERLAERGVRQVITTNNETYRASYIENEMGFDRRVERVFASGRMGVAKPAAEYFEMVVENLGVEPAGLLLLDDHAENIRAAARLGWQAIHFTDQTRESLEVLLPL